MIQTEVNRKSEVITINARSFEVLVEHDAEHLNELPVREVADVGGPANHGVKIAKYDTRYLSSMLKITSMRDN